MDTHEKLDKIIGMLEVIIEKQEEHEEEQAELREAVANLSLPGSGYDTFRIEDN